MRPDTYLSLVDQLGIGRVHQAVSYGHNGIASDGHDGYAYQQADDGINGWISKPRSTRGYSEVSPSVLACKLSATMDAEPI